MMARISDAAADSTVEVRVSHVTITSLLAQAALEPDSTIKMTMAELLHLLSLVDGKEMGALKRAHKSRNRLYCHGEFLLVMETLSIFWRGRPFPGGHGQRLLLSYLIQQDGHLRSAHEIRDALFPLIRTTQEVPVHISRVRSTLASMWPNTDPKRVVVNVRDGGYYLAPRFSR